MSKLLKSSLYLVQIFDKINVAYRANDCANEIKSEQH